METYWWLLVRTTSNSDVPFSYENIISWEIMTLVKSTISIGFRKFEHPYTEIQMWWHCDSKPIYNSTPLISSYTRNIEWAICTDLHRFLPKIIPHRSDVAVMQFALLFYSDFILPMTDANPRRAERRVGPVSATIGARPSPPMER